MKRKLPNLHTIAGVRELLRIIRRLDDAGRAVILDALSEELSDAKKVRFLTLIKSATTQADKEVRDWILKGISKSYVEGTNIAVNELKSIRFKPPAGAPPLAPITVELLTSAPFMKPHLEAVNILLSDAYLDFGNAMNGFVKGAEKILNDTLKRQIRSKIAVGRLDGASIPEIKRTVRQSFENRGFTVLLDRGGKRWSLPRYSEMVARTHIIKANNEGTINRAGDFEVDIVEISSHGATDALCAPQEGELYSISGKSPNYKPLGRNEPPFHPNCRHSLMLRPDL